MPPEITRRARRRKSASRGGRKKVAAHKTFVTTVRRRRRAHDPEATRRALLDAGAELFAARGFDGVRVDELARRADVNRALISYHFGGKEGLYKAILKTSFAGLSKPVAALGRSREPPDQLLRAVVRKLGGAMAERPEVPRMMLREVMAGGQRIDAELVALLISVVQTVRGIVLRGRRTGIFRPVDPIATHFSLVGSLVFFFGTQHFREQVFEQYRVPGLPPPPGAAAFLEHMEELMLQGISAHRPRRRPEK